MREGREKRKVYVRQWQKENKDKVAGYKRKYRKENPIFKLKENIRTRIYLSLQEKNKSISTFLKSFHGAPLFTLKELKLWEKCFNAIGLKRLGRYPRKKDLSQPK